MKIINTKTHGLLDYLLSALLLASPWLLGFASLTLVMLCAVVAGGVMLLLALITDYEPGLVRVVPMPLHLFFDILLSFFLIAVPWLLRFPAAVAWLFLLTGLVLILLTMLSHTSPRKAV